MELEKETTKILALKRVKQLGKSLLGVLKWICIVQEEGWEINFGLFY